MSSKLKKLLQYIIKLDIIGPEIKLYNMEENDIRHKSFSGGLLSIIYSLLGFTFTVYFFMDIVMKSNPKAYQVTRYQDDVPKLNFGKNGMFFGLSYINPRNSSINMYDEKATTFFGVMKTFKKGDVIADYKFEKCVYSKDFLGLESLFTESYIEEINETFLCVSSMLKDGKEFKKGDPNFISPYTAHGMGSKSNDPVFFEVGANRCQNSTDNNNSCYPNEVIEQMLVGSNYKINFIDNMFDTNNYENPINSFVHQIDGQASPNTFAANYMNLLNVEFRTHDGLVFDNVNQLNSFKFNDRVEIVSAITPESPNFHRIFMFRLELQNTPNLYERYYTRLQEVMGSIGGMLKFLLIVSKIMNSFLNFLSEKNRVLRNVVMKFVNIHQMSKNIVNGKIIFSKRNVGETFTITNMDNFLGSSDKIRQKGLSPNVLNIQEKKRKIIPTSSIYRIILFRIFQPHSKVLALQNFSYKTKTIFSVS